MSFENRSASSPRRETLSETCWIPNTDVYITEAGLAVKVELAGIQREELELTAEGNRLKISGHRRDGCRVAKCRFLVMEINYAEFERIIEIPNGFDLSQARAIYQNGFLHIDVPAVNRPPQKPVSVPITGE